MWIRFGESYLYKLALRQIDMTQRQLVVLEPGFQQNPSIWSRNLCPDMFKNNSNAYRY